MKYECRHKIDIHSIFNLGPLTRRFPSSPLT